MKFGEVVQRVQNPPDEGQLATSVVSLATAAVTMSAIRRYTNVGAAVSEPRNSLEPDVQGVVAPEGESDVAREGARRQRIGGVNGSGAHEEDDPGTWETLTLCVKSGITGDR